MESYGLATERTLPDTPTEQDGTANFSGTPASLHAISNISERDFSVDFAADALDDKLHSSIAESTPDPRRILCPANQDGAEAVDITTVLMDTSQVDARGYKISRYVPCPRTTSATASTSTGGP